MSIMTNVKFKNILSAIHVFLYTYSVDELNEVFKKGEQK